MKSEPIIYLDVNVTMSRKGRIALRRGDDPERLAADFSHIFHLTPAAQEELTHRIIEAFNIYYSTPNQWNLQI